MPQKPPPPPAPPPPRDDGDRRSAEYSRQGRTEQVPGLRHVTMGRLPAATTPRPRDNFTEPHRAPEPPAYELEPTRPEVPVARREHQRTLPGNGPSSMPAPAPAASQGPPRSLSPAPVSVPTSVAEREAAKLRAELQDAKEELKKASAGTSFELKLRGLNIVAILTALGGLGLGANATFRQSKAPPEAVAAQGTRLTDNERETSAAREWQLAWARYERARLEAQECRDRQVAAAFYRLGYRLPQLPQGDVHWLSEYKDDPHAVRKAPQYRPEADCPPMPTPPGSPSP